jgi:hypothetical protein
MARLTKYSSFKALKLDAASSEANSMDAGGRYLAFEKFINLLRTELNKKQGDNSNKPIKKT